MVWKPIAPTSSHSVKISNNFDLLDECDSVIGRLSRQGTLSPVAHDGVVVGVSLEATCNVEGLSNHKEPVENSNHSLFGNDFTGFRQFWESGITSTMSEENLVLGQHGALINDKFHLLLINSTNASIPLSVHGCAIVGFVSTVPPPFSVNAHLSPTPVLATLMEVHLWYCYKLFVSNILKECSLFPKCLFRRVFTALGYKCTHCRQ